MGTAKEKVEVIMREIFYDLDYTFTHACCDHLLVKSFQKDFKQKDGLGTFSICLDIEWQPLIVHGACVFRDRDTKNYLYRSKYGNWVVGENFQFRNTLHIELCTGRVLGK